jgi:hypothetical protein
MLYLSFTLPIPLFHLNIFSCTNSLRMKYGDTWERHEKTVNFDTEEVVLQQDEYIIQLEVSHFVACLRLLARVTLTYS